MKKIWLADDDEDDREIFQQALKNIPGIELLTSANGVELMSVLEHSVPSEGDIILLDTNMPKMNGKQTLDALKSNGRFAGLPVVIFSTSCLPHLIDEMYAHGADYYIIKPDCFEKLEHVIAELLVLAQNKNCRATRENFVIGEDHSSFYRGLYYPGMRVSA